ncbi:MAG: superoxide dismutase family protein [Sediminicola sp.]|tara:strand:+ start:105615 stop:106208 length:594 start_codon:yes stop_codon:yes gene_type:complete
MKKTIFLSLGILLVAVSSCKEVKKETNEASEDMNNDVMEVTEEKVDSTETITFTMEPKSDSGVTGEVTFTQEGDKVKMMAELTGLSEGEHAIHIHEKADCSAADGTSTGGHWNPTFQPHGKWGAEEGYHKGDIGNLTADADGNATVEFETEEWCLGCNEEAKNIIGKAVIVHQGVDDFKTQPTGDAGARVSCTGIIQ